MFSANKVLLKSGNKGVILIPGLLLLTTINFNPSMDKYLHPLPYDMWDEATYPFPNFNGETVEVCKWITIFAPYFTGRVITYPRRD